MKKSKVAKIDETSFLGFTMHAGWCGAGEKYPRLPDQAALSVPLLQTS